MFIISLPNAIFFAYDIKLKGDKEVWFKDRWGHESYLELKDRREWDIMKHELYHNGRCRMIEVESDGSKPYKALLGED